MQAIDLKQLMLFQAGWWVFATVAAFVAAGWFWNKGAAQLTGSPVGGSKVGMKMSGAGAIWGITLLLFSYFQPLKDYCRIFVVTTAQETRQGATISLVGNDERFVKALQEARAKLGGGDLALELIYRKAAFPLIPEVGNNFGYPDPIPAGYYELRVTNSEGKQKSIGLDLAAPTTH